MEAGMGVEAGMGSVEAGEVANAGITRSCMSASYLPRPGRLLVLDDDERSDAEPSRRLAEDAARARRQPRAVPVQARKNGVVFCRRAGPTAAMATACREPVLDANTPP